MVVGTVLKPLSLSHIFSLMFSLSTAGQFRADLKSIAVSVQRQMERHCGGTGESEEETQK